MKLFGVAVQRGRAAPVWRYVPEGIVLIIKDHDGSKERERLLMKGGRPFPAITDRPPGGCGVEGISPIRGSKMQLQVEVRRNEVWLKITPGEGTGRGPT